MIEKPPALADHSLDLLLKFEGVVREVFHGETWRDVEPFIARAFALLELDHEVGVWHWTRDYLQATWRS
ncbi:hypothetical protein LF41_305 [Lysobacter dokdonensis DS-58]|uniref:Uncharacterized protein n=1 Tax=Lysobacter dokdonensis DS-58 TaxID=1300345 RepID=A0A0A2WJ81_9GAMM|nr:hypothetical protein [Lysobacter dokdonensis]KGQ18772.1 hypothetical protein LF41_305 [Lysobacter dokdonensis DS-58]